jgi:hypothetical protein
MPVKVHDGGQDGQRDNARDHPGNDEVAERVHRGCFERINLFGHTHGAQFGADARADPPRQQQARG